MLIALLKYKIFHQIAGSKYDPVSPADRCCNYTIQVPLR